MKINKNIMKIIEKIKGEFSTNGFKFHINKNGTTAVYMQGFCLTLFGQRFYLIHL